MREPKLSQKKKNELELHKTSQNYPKQTKKTQNDPKGDLNWPKLTQNDPKQNLNWP